MSGWLWLVIAVIVIALVAFLFIVNRSRRPTDAGGAAPAGPADGGAAPAVDPSAS